MSTSISSRQGGQRILLPQKSVCMDVHAWRLYLALVVARQHVVTISAIQVMPGKFSLHHSYLDVVDICSQLCTKPMKTDFVMEEI